MWASPCGTGAQAGWMEPGALCEHKTGQLRTQNTQTACNGDANFTYYVSVNARLHKLKLNVTQ